MLKPIAECSAKDLFNEYGGIDESTCLAIYDQYRKDRSKSVFMMCNEADPHVGQFWIYDSYIMDNARNPMYCWDILSKKQEDWDDAINKENKEHTQWVIQQPKRVKAVMDYKSIVIPREIATLIILLANPEPKIVSIDPNNIDNAFAVAYKSHFVACINCSNYMSNFGWKLIDVTEKQLQEHCETKWHKIALTNPDVFR